LLSSQIEGTQASFVDILAIDHTDKQDIRKSHIDEVVNYVAAMNHGLDRLASFPLSLRLIREIHEILMSGVRGSEKNPGEFRRTQNWIGPQGCTLTNATFIPPTVPEMNRAMGDLELFMHDEENRIPPLIKIAYIHAQFETIHPFLDGNGRVGRLLIAFWLCYKRILNHPLLYLSYYFKQNRTEYYDRLMDIRTKGAWEKWVNFFLKGVSEVADESIDSAKQIIRLKDKYTDALLGAESANNSIALFNTLFTSPVITRTQVAEHLKVSSPTAGTIVENFCLLGILKDITPDRIRNKKYSFAEYLAIFEKGTEN